MEEEHQVHRFIVCLRVSVCVCCSKGEAMVIQKHRPRVMTAYCRNKRHANVIPKQLEQFLLGVYTLRCCLPAMRVGASGLGVVHAHD